MNPFVAELFSFFMSAFAREVNVLALESTVIGCEEQAPFTDCTPAIIADADEIFLDPDTRPEIVSLLSKWAAKKTARTGN